MEATRPFDATRTAVLQDPEAVAAYLAECLVDGDIALSTFALREVAAAEPDMSPLQPDPQQMTDMEVYTPERIAEFLLSNAVGEEEIAAARREVVAMGLDPDRIGHFS